MYFVIEAQIAGDGTGAVLPAITKETKNEAESVYYQILASAAISSVAHHGAIIFDEEMCPLLFKSYEHEQEVTE